MRLSKDSLVARIRAISREKGIPADVLYSRFFFDSFIARLSATEYKNNFILKGGLLLSSLLGPSARTTVDLDFLVNRIEMDAQKIISIVKEIAFLDFDDGVSFEYQGYDDIRKDDAYGGFSIHLIGVLSNIQMPFSIDIATGDPVTPKAKKLDYQCYLTGEVLKIDCYPMETVIAEKFETVLSRGLFNSRVKDFYDLHILKQEYADELDCVILKDAFSKTCRHRQFSLEKDEAADVIASISESEILRQRWDVYSKKFSYATNVTWHAVVDAFRYFLNVLY